MKHPIRLLIHAVALWVAAGAAHAAERVTNGAFTTNASSFSVFYGLNGYSPNPSSIPNWTRGGPSILYSGVEGTATSLSPKSTFGPGNYGNRTFAIVQSSTGVSSLSQAITLPIGFYKIQYDVACCNGQAANYQVVVTNSAFTDIPYSSGSKAASSAAFVTITDYFGRTGSAAQAIYLQNLTAGAYACFANVSVQDATPPAPTVGNNTPVNQGSTVTLTASSPYTSDPNAFTWNGPVLTNQKGNNLSFGNAQPGWSGTYTCTVTVAGVTSVAASTTVTVNPVSTTITVTQAANGTISPGTTAPAYGGNQTFSITPDAGYAVASLTVDGGSVAPATSYTFYNVTAPHTLTASYAPISTTITVTQAANGTISPGTTAPAYGGSQTFSITPDTGYAVATLTVDGGSVAPATSYTFTNVTATHTLTATYAPITTTITVTQTTNGTISPGTIAPAYGGSQTFNITPATGYAVATLTVDGGSVAPATSYTFTNVTAPHTLTATYAPIPTTITVAQTVHGTISPGTTAPAYGTDQAFSITPDTGYAVASLTVDGGPVTPAASYTFHNVTATHTLTATYAAIPTTITVTQSAHGTISPGTTAPAYGTDQAFNITPDAGYTVATLTVDGNPVASATNYTFINVTSTHTLTATYAVIPTTITVTQSAHGTISPGTTAPAYGTDQAFSITPDAGYAVATLTVDGNPVAPATNYTFISVTEVHTLTATFLTPYEAWLAANGKSASPENLKEYAYGTTNPGAIAVLDPAHITLGQAPAVQITDGMVSTVFGRRTNPEGLTYAVEFCDELGTWYSSDDTDHLKYDPSADPNPVVIASQDGMDAVSVPFPIFIKEGTGYVKMSKTFMRVVVTSN